MASRRNKGPWDPNKSDSEDETFEDTPRASGKRRKPHATSSRRTKRPRRNDYGSDSEVSESESNESQEDFSLGSDEDNVEMNDKGRPVRRAAKAEKSYLESSDNEENEPAAKSEDIDSDDELAKSARARRRQRSGSVPRRSLIVKLRTPRVTRHTTAGKSIKTTATGDKTIAGGRRSSRLSNNQDDALIALTDSGRHEQVMRSGTRSPEPVGRRSARAGKTVATTTSIIAEASQENSGEQLRAGDEEAVEDEPEMDVDDDDDDDAVKFDTHVEEDEEQVIQESQPDPLQEDDDEDEDAGPLRPKRTASFPALADPSVANSPEPSNQRRSRDLKRKKGMEESSEYEMNPEEDENEDEGMSGSDESESPRKRSRGSASDSGAGRRSQRISEKKRNGSDSEASGIDQDELAEELRELKHTTGGGRRSRRRQSPDIIYDRPKNLRNRTTQVDYRIINPELNPIPDDDDPPIPPAGRRGGGYSRSLFSTMGPFGGAGGPMPMFGGPDDVGAVGGVESDSSDDEAVQQRPGRRDTIGGAVGMTPTAALNPQQAALNALNADPAQNASGSGPANLGKVKDRKALADADPLGVDPNVTFGEVGGLDGHINQLKEMVMLPLLYPEVFQRFHTTPPRGVLFHGPPGTGKTLLARALAATVSSQGQKVTFYMRKGADALSKWVGEAERQLRMLFEQARQNQPSIIFFDEIDGLAPVRSSKQDQIHSSIVATLLALMDGMDGRGQVIVIGATNRPDSVDPALRRPGRFDREFYFPLPTVSARRSIIDIHTKGWDPPLEPKFKDQLALLTKGYGGADLRALCTEAALNAVQGTYPQIYQSEKKLVIDPANIKVLAKDFMISVNKIVPSSGRAASSDAKALDGGIAALLNNTFQRISEVVDEALPEKKQTTALEEAEYGERDDEDGFEREIMQQAFDSSRIFRPRLLVHGAYGMGQQHIAGALLNKFERLHVQSFDLSVLYGDSTISPEATVIRLFNEARRHKPSVIYIPNVNTWYESVGPAVIRLFTSQLRSLPPNEPIMVLGIMEHDRPTEEDAEGLADYQDLLKDLFGFTTQNRFMLERPQYDERYAYFDKVVEMIKMKPTDFPDPATRKKRTLPELPVAPTPAAAPSPQQGQEKEQLKAQKKQDRHTLNLLKIALDPIMNQITRKYRKFRAPVIDQRYYEYLFDERDPTRVSTDVPEEQREQEMRPYEIRKDEKGVEGLLEVVTGKFYYNLEIVTIEKRLSNGYYKRPKDFLADIKRLVKDARTSGDPERTLRGNELLANVEVDITLIGNNNPTLVERCEQVYQREKQRERQMQESIKETDAANGVVLTNLPQPLQISRTTEPSTGPVILGEPVPGRSALPPVTPQRGVAQPISSEQQQPPSRQLTNGSAEHQLEREDTHMTNGEDTSGANNGQKGNENNEGEQSQPVQKSGFMAMGENTQAADYHNSASSTSSGHKAHDASHSSNGVSHEHPNFSMIQQHHSGASDLPDTQENPSSGSQPSQKQSQPFDAQSMPPPRQTSNINALLNASEPTPSHIVETDKVEQLQHELGRATSGCSVEQLEALNAAIMNVVWKNRADWNRMRIVRAVEKAFNAKIEDIERTEGIARSSQEEPRRNTIRLNLSNIA